MLIVIPPALYGRLGALLSALIVAFGVIGLTMHKDFYAGRPRKDFYCFYTNLSNLLVLVYFALVAPRLYASKTLRPLIPRAEFSVMMSIMLTFFVFHLLIFPTVRRELRCAPHTQPFFVLAADNVILHYLVPWLVFTYWLLCSPGKSTLDAGDALLWTLIPLAYLLFIALRAHTGRVIEETGSPYPYAFLDVHALGARRVWRICYALYALCVAAGLILVFAISLTASGFGTNHALILI